MRANQAEPSTIPIRKGPDKFSFTVANLNAITPPSHGRLYVYDARTPSLAFCVTSAGSRTFYLYRRIEGVPRRIKLGKFPPMTIEGARLAALRVHGQVDVEGIDPGERRRKQRQEVTLGTVWDDYLEKWIRVRCSPGTLQSDTSRWKRLEQWKTRRLSAITKMDVRALHAKLGTESGETNANRVVQLIRRLYNYADKAFDLELHNPAAKVDFFPEESRERYMQSDELGQFFSALEAEPDDVLRDFFATCLWTGGRRSNVLEMRWDEINLDLAIWTIPAEKFKTGKQMTVPLSPPAMAILTRRKAEAISDWVFPGHGKTGHLVEPKLAWDRLLTRAGIQDLHLHDLRRTLGSWQAAGGASLAIIGKSLGHASQQTTAIYARLNLDPVRESVNAAAAAIQAAAKPARKKKCRVTNGKK